jgi:hypothetical protein
VGVGGKRLGPGSWCCGVCGMLVMYIRIISNSRVHAGYVRVLDGGVCTWLPSQECACQPTECQSPHLCLPPAHCSGRDRSRSRSRSRGRSKSRSRSRGRSVSRSRSRSKSRSRSRSRSKSRSRSRWAQCCGGWGGGLKALLCRQALCRSCARGTAVHSNCYWLRALLWPCCSAPPAHSTHSSAPVLPRMLVHHTTHHSHVRIQH